jgi:hypothetical protein
MSDFDNENKPDKRPREKFSLRNNWPNASSVSIHLIAGLVVVILGVLTLLDNMQIVELRSPMRYFWSAVFLSIGSALVIENRSDTKWKWGIGWICLGVWSFAYNSGWVDVSISHLLWPLILLAAGGYLVRRALVEGDGRPSNSGTDTNSSTNSDSSTSQFAGSDSPRPNAPRYSERTVRGIGVLSGSELKPSTQAMERAELFALMGGVKLDLYDTQLLNDTATINVAACMGGIEILVPSEWTVVSNVLPLMGAFIDKRRPAAATTMAVTTKKTLTINGFVLMGGIEVKN